MQKILVGLTGLMVGGIFLWFGAQLSHEAEYSLNMTFYELGAAWADILGLFGLLFCGTGISYLIHLRQFNHIDRQCREGNSK